MDKYFYFRTEADADNDSAILNGPASVDAVLAFDVNVSFGVIFPIIVCFSLLYYTTPCRYSFKRDNYIVFNIFNIMGREL